MLLVSVQPITRQPGSYGQYAMTQNLVSQSCTAYKKGVSLDPNFDFDTEVRRNQVFRNTAKQSSPQNGYLYQRHLSRVPVDINKEKGS